ncbi:hypothetical protein [Maribacter sp. 1_MG-2023]|uniref:hypothetical protein n=1 Tax=Maribacter sp. 1_MG-2023 TaxID=3062677 RepID=UPI0026E3FEC7|nr:hypothetical protein [Maribacter sp. 1_MG-2023]MDO6470943.1 hypothetical protein [Maribacter sp. 1_MG-2023]
MGEIIAELLLIWEELKFWKKKKERRKFEEENNLPKKLMFRTSTLILLFAMGFIIVARIIGFFYFSDKGTDETEEKIAQITTILNEEKKDLGIYPEELKIIIRNNPLRQNITLDYWKNEFHYEQLDYGLNYVLKSKGKDGILGSEDDISGKKKLALTQPKHDTDFRFKN